MARLWLPLLLSPYAARASLHNLTRACMSSGNTTAHEWPYEDCCDAYKGLNESVWCAAGVRNSSGFEALNAWSGDGYGAYRVADECGAALPQCFVDADREATAIKLTKLIDWGPSYEDDTLKWDAEMTAICHADIEYWQPHIGAYIGRNEFIEYAYTLSPKFNGGAFLHSPINIVDIAKGEGDWVMTYTWRTAAGFNDETLDGKPDETTILKLGFSDDPGQAYRLTYTEFSRPTYEFMSQISMTPTVLCGTALAYCPGTLFPYDSMDACVTYLTETVPGACLDGAGGFFSGDTRACRQMHLQLALLDPIVHCPHLGPDSEKCTAEARSGTRVTAYCDATSPPFGLERDATRPGLAACGVAFLLVPAVLALVLVAAGARGWGDVAAPAAPEPTDARRRLIHLVSSKSLADSSLRRSLGSSVSLLSLPRDASGLELSPMRRDASPLRDRPDWTSHRPVPRFVDDDACSGAPPAAEDDGAHPDELPARRVGIQFRDIAIDAISWRGGEPRRLVRGLHGAVAPATLTAIVGPSGSGKTTLLKVLAGREALYGLKATGRLRVTEYGDKATPRSRAWAAARSQYSSFATEVPLTGALTCGEQLRFYALTIPALNASTAARLQRAAAVALETGLKAHDGTRVDRLSEGLYRRLLVAIRLLVLPSILCLDELTTGQDAGTALALTMGAGQLARRGLAVVVVVHQPAAELFALFDQVIAVRPGGAGCDVASPQAICDAVAALRPQRSDLAANPADVLLGDALQGSEIFAPPPDFVSAVVPAEKATLALGVDALCLRTAALKAARFYRASGPGQVFGYLATAMLLALVLVTLFDRVDAPREPASTAEGGDVVFILFVGLTTLCGISNFQVNCGACPIEWKRFERNAASQYDSPLAHWLFVCGRDVLVVTSGATPYFLATFAGCEMGPMSRLAPCVVVFLLAQHAFHAAGSLFYYVSSPRESALCGIAFSGVYNFIIFLLAGVVVPLAQMPPFWRGIAKLLPGANAMGLMVFYLFADRPFDCDALAHPTICSDGDVVVEHFGFEKFEDRVGSAVAVIIMNYVLARLLLLAILVRSACRRGTAPFGAPPVDDDGSSMGPDSPLTVGSDNTVWSVRHAESGSPRLWPGDQASSLRSAEAV